MEIGTILPYAVFFGFIYMFLFESGVFPTFTRMVEQASYNRKKHKSEIKADGTIRDLAAIIDSCHINDSSARELHTITLGDNDIRNQYTGKIIGMIRENQYVIFYLSKRWFRFVLVVPYGMLTTVDQPHVGLRARDIRTYDGDFYFPVPLNTSSYAKHSDKWDEWCSLVRTRISLIRMKGDLETDRDWQTKRALRERHEVNYEIKEIESKLEGVKNEIESD